MITRISAVIAIVVSGGILFSVGSPAVAKSAGVNKASISISREAKLIRVIRAKLARRVAVEKPQALIAKGRVSETKRAAEHVELVRGKAQRAADPVALVRERAKRAADPVEAVQP